MKESTMEKSFYVFLLLAGFTAIFFFSCSDKTGESSAVDNSGEILPFSPAPSASVTGETILDSKHQRRKEVSHLPEDAPNILIVLIDDVGFGVSEIFDVGVDLGSPVSLRYHEKAPFKFSGKIEKVKVDLM